MSKEIKTLTTIQHILAKPSLWIGGVAPSEKEAWVIEEDGSISLKKVLYTEGLLKVCNESIDNSLDAGIKSNWKFSTKIDITITNDTFTCIDNGMGIPVKKNEEGKWIPEIATCIPLSGSNFTDDDRKSIGTNGVGIKAANIYSKYFECVTCDGKGKLKIVCKDNLSSVKVTELAPSAKTGTKISFKPDFDRFGVKEFRAELKSLIKTRLKILSWFFPKCTFTFNGEKLNIKAKEVASMFPQPSVVLNEPNVYICVYPSEEPYSLTYVNGISLGRGGTHIDYILNKIIEDIREKVGKKYKTIKPADIKNKLGIVCFLKDFPNCAFDSQTKETLTNSQADIGNYLKTNEIDLDKFTSKILKEKVIIDNITDFFKLKEEMAEKKAIDKLNKTKKDIDSDKYVAPVGKSPKKYLALTEGFSAFSGISPILGRQGIAYYQLRGKVLNVLDLPITAFMKNQEVSDLVNILDIDLKNPDTDMSFEKVVILSDQDADGSAIAALAICLFGKLAPKMLKDGRICRMETPLLIGTDNKGTVKQYFFKFPKKEEMDISLNWSYMKGLGSLTKKTFTQILDKVGGMEGLIKPFEYDEKTFENIQKWFGKNTDKRKEALRNKAFNIEGV